VIYRLRRFWESLNKLTLACVLALMAAGWALVLSASLPPGQESLLPLPEYAVRQAIWMSLALMVLLAGVSVDYHVLLRLAPWFYGAGLMLLILVLGVGITSFGARRWFALGKVYAQPGEFVKLGVLLLTVQLAAAPVRVRSLRRPAWPRRLATGVLAVGVPMALVASQPNLGTALLLFVSAVAVWIVAGIPWSVFVSTAAAAAGAAPFLWAFLKDYQRARILNFLNPYRDPLGGGYSVIQSIMAIGSGGMFGKGYANGTQNRLEYIPKHHTDFIGSVLGEEMGWVGCCALLVVYMLLYLEGFRIAHRARDTAGAYLAVGITALLAAQTVINLGMNIGIMPVTGLPLPLLSYGGSSLLINAGLLGILLNIGRQERR
jgi:rod shape determining protein RodA